MPTPEGYLLSEKDIRQLEKYLYYAQRAFRNRNVQFDDSIDHEELSSPEIYVARTPDDGIPGIYPDSVGTGAEPSFARCQVFKLAMRNGTMETVSFTRDVYNISATAIDGGKWIVALRDKFGIWYGIDILPSGSTGFPAELISEYDISTGYEWVRQKLNDDGTFSDHPNGQTGIHAYTPDEDDSLTIGTRGWLFPSPDAVGTGTGTGTGSGTGTSDNYWIFLPVYRTRVYCGTAGLVNQRSIDGGLTWEDLDSLGVACDDGTGTGTADDIVIGGCGWVAGLRSKNCLKMEVISASGYCETIDLEQILYLSWNGTKWESGLTTPGTFSTGTADDLFCYVGACGTVLFWIQDGYPRITINGTYLVWNRCGRVGGENFIEFTGGNTLCDPEGTADVTNCEDHTFVVRLKCVECPVRWYCVAIDGECEGTAPTITALELTLDEVEQLGDLVCSGPYLTEAEALVVCGSSFDVGCIEGLVPSSVCLTFGGPLSSLGSVTATSIDGTNWNAGTLPAVELCPGVTVTAINFIHVTDCEFSVGVTLSDGGNWSWTAIMTNDVPFTAATTGSPLVSIGCPETIDLGATSTVTIAGNAC